MGRISAVTDDFYCDKTDRNDASLYTSFRCVNGTSKTISNRYLQSRVVDYIRKHSERYSSMLQSGSVEKYCLQVEKGKVRGGKVELDILAKVGWTVIRVVSVTKTADNNVDIKIVPYGEEIDSFTECVYILCYEETGHYYPLYIANKEKPDEKTTIFRCDDQIVAGLLEKFIRTEFPSKK